jgi:hypothetical protein
VIPRPFEEEKREMDLLQLGKRSEWDFVTCNGLSVSGGVLAGEGGTITLREPSKKSDVRFYLGAVGAGISGGFRLPKLKVPRIQGAKIGGGAGSLEAMRSGGYVFMAPTFGGAELTRQDIRGGCLFVEGAAGFAWGAAGVAMVFGMNPLTLLSGLNNPGNLMQALLTATGFLLTLGMNFGIQAGGGVTGYVGMLYASPG